ncbi:MAG: hypothetical protein ABI221_03590 [Candidatus Saccharimonadales bacterium]
MGEVIDLFTKKSIEEPVFTIPFAEDSTIISRPHEPISSAEFAQEARRRKTMQLSIDGITAAYRLAKPKRLPVRLIIVEDPKFEQVQAVAGSGLKTPTQVAVPVSFPQVLHDDGYLGRQEAMLLAASYSYAYGTLVDGVRNSRSDRGVRASNKAFQPECWQPAEAFLGNRAVIVPRVAAAVALDLCGIDEPVMLHHEHSAQPSQLAALQNPAVPNDVSAFHEIVQAAFQRRF